MANIRDEGRHADNGSFMNSEIRIYLDKSDQQLTYFLEKKLRETYREFAENMMTDCEMPRRLGNVPIRFEKPIFGTFDDEFTTYIAPGVVMT